MNVLVFVASLVLMLSGVKGTAHLSFNASLELNITRDGCGASKLCVETPADCDPAKDATCLFVSLTASDPMPPNGRDISIELRGESEGYIALALTQNASEGTSMVFVCARNSTGGNFFFRTRTLNNTNGMLTPSERRVKDIRGNVTGNVIRCEFTIPAVNASRSITEGFGSLLAITGRAADSTFSVLLGNGNTTGTTINSFTTRLNSGPLNIANPASNVATTTAATTTMVANTTMAANSTSTAIQPQAAVVLLGVICMAATSLGV